MLIVQAFKKQKPEEYVDMAQINSVGMIASSVMVGGVWWT